VEIVTHPDTAVTILLYTVFNRYTTRLNVVVLIVTGLMDFFLDNYTSNKAFRIAKPLKAGVRIAARPDVSVTIATC